jgi:uncharacterized protein (TIGR02452 family)
MSGKSKLYKVVHTRPTLRTSPISIRVTDETTTEAIANAITNGNRVVALNFANNEKPHGGYDFRRGHTQEDYLFRETTIADTLKQEHYPICETPEDIRAFVSTGVRMQETTPCAQFMDVRNKTFAIITIAALRGPRVRHDLHNINIERYEHVQDRKNTEKRIKLICQIASRLHVHTLVTGAWGCGVFCNPIYEVCTIWKKYIALYEIPEVVFAIPAGDIHDRFAGFL